MTQPETIPITKPVTGDREKELVCRVLDSGWLVQGPMVKRMEEMFASFCGSRRALAVTSCTTGLHLMLHALGLGPGDEVVIPSFTFVATANAIETTGATPVLADIDLATFNLDLESVRRKIGPKTRAIMPVSLFGLCADMEAVNSLAADKGLMVLEDAACAMGASRQGRHAGVEARAAAFSFHPRKAVTTGEGGMVITDDDDLADAMEQIRNHGAGATDLERHYSQGGSLLPSYERLGFNYRLTDLQGALGVAQMERAESIISQRRQAAAYYHELLAGQDLVRPPQEPVGYCHAYQSYVVLFTAGGEPAIERLEELNRRRNRLMSSMEKQGIQVRQGTHAVHTLGYYARRYGLSPQSLPGSLLADRLTITLPLYAGIGPEQQQRVVSALLAQGAD